MIIDVRINPDEEAGEYMISCARIRNMTVTAMVREIVEKVAQDQLVLAVLDDDGRHRHTRYQRKFKDPVRSALA